MGTANSRVWPILLLVVLCGPLALVAGLLVWHSVYIGLFAPPEVLELYQFGAEAMGWRHQSRQVYLISGLIEVALMFAAIGLLAWWLFRRPARKAVDRPENPDVMSN